MLPINLTQSLVEAARRSPADYARLSDYGAQLARKGDLLNFFFEERPEYRATCGTVERKPGQRPTWKLDSNYRRAVEPVVIQVRPDLMRNDDTPDDPFNEQKKEPPMTDNGKDGPTVAVSEKHAEHNITTYAGRGQIREAMERFKAGLSIKDATEHEYAALAHLSLKYDIDPFNGEAWIIPNKGVMVGIKGLRKMANRQAKELDCRWWTEFQDVRNVDEALKYGIPEKVRLAKVCILRRSDHIEAWANALKIMKEAAPDLSYEIIKEAIGAPPIFVGVGYVEPGESSKMPLPQLAMKRAEAHAIKQAFDVEQGTEGDGSYDATAIEIRRIDDPDDRDPTPTDPADKPEVIEAEVATDTPAETPGTAPETPEATEPVAESTQAPETPETATPAVRTGKPKAVKDVTRATLIDQLKSRTPVTFQEAAELLNTTLKTEYEPKGYYLSVIKSLRARRDDLSTDTIPAIADVWPDLIALAASA